MVTVPWVRSHHWILALENTPGARSGLWAGRLAGPRLEALTMTLAPQGVRQAAAAADGHEGPAEELRRLPQAAQAVVAALRQGGSGGAPRGTGKSRPHAGLLRGSGPGAGTLPSCPRAQNLSRVRSCLWGLEGRELGGVSGVDCRGAAGRGWGGSRGSSRAVQALPAHHGPVS